MRHWAAPSFRPTVTPAQTGRWPGCFPSEAFPNRTTVCKTLSPLGAGKDDTANIQRAIEACPLGQVVLLSAGAFTVGEGHYVLLNRGVTLRGAGPCAGAATCTLMQRTDGCKPLSPTSSGACGASPTPIIIVGPERWNNDTVSTNLTADAAAGSHSIQVASAAGFSVGQIVLLDELSGARWMPDLGRTDRIWAAPDYRVTYNMHWPASPDDDPGNCTNAGCGGGNTAFTWFSRYDRPTSEHHKISAISGNTIAFDSPVTISYRTSHTAQLSRYRMAHTTNAGVENMTLSGADRWATSVRMGGEFVGLSGGMHAMVRRVHGGRRLVPNSAGAVLYP